LKSDSLLHRIRLLTLATLSCGHSSVSFATIATELKVDESDVDLWVLEAMKEGYIDAKIDELESTVIIRLVQSILKTKIL